MGRAGLGPGVSEAPISAGDVGRFVYCPLNWKLASGGARGEGGRHGMEVHQDLAETVDALESYQQSAKVSVQTSLVWALAAISAAILAVEYFVLRAERMPWFVFLLAAVMMVAGSLYLVVFFLYYRRRAQQLLRSRNIQSGEIAFSDIAGNRRLLRSRLYPLQGTPDYIVKRENAYVPVELKTGKTPQHPYESHVLQLASYCLLLKEEFGVRPPVGVLAYPERHFEVAFTPELEDQVLRTLLRIQLAQRTGEAHRNHENPRRCMGCSRREGCPERLA